ncbi:MAG: hypothetical protein IJF01_04475, partial [Tidjanibacter sp.]|nr:hypothetical protein [Tidjanibacter sp.]
RPLSALSALSAPNFQFSQMRVSESKVCEQPLPSGSILDKIHFVNFQFSILIGIFVPNAQKRKINT